MVYTESLRTGTIEAHGAVAIFRSSTCMTRTDYTAAPMAVPILDRAGPGRSLDSSQVRVRFELASAVGLCLVIFPMQLPHAALLYRRLARP